MNRLELIEKVRAITELTTADVSDDVVAMYARDGYQRLMALERRWPFFAARTTFDTVANQSEYPLAQIGDGISEIVSIMDGQGYRLRLINNESAEDFFGIPVPGRPQVWSMWGDKIELWPTPNDVYPLTVRNYRNPVAWWDSATTEIDCDERLHVAIVYFTLSRLYELQEDAEMASFYANTAAEAARAAHDDIMRPPADGPVRLNSGLGLGMSSWLGG